MDPLGVGPTDSGRIAELTAKSNSIGFRRQLNLSTTSLAEAPTISKTTNGFSSEFRDRAVRLVHNLKPAAALRHMLQPLRTRE